MRLLCDRDSLHLMGAASGDAAVAAGVGSVDGRRVVCYGHDAGRSGGSVGAAEAQAIVDALRIAGDRRLPVVAFQESAGARLQDGALALDGLARIFAENVALSGGVPQISVVAGTSAGGGSYSPALTDFVVMTRSAAMFLTGPGVVKEVTGEDMAIQELGGPQVHERSGVCHFVACDDREGVAVARELLRYLPIRGGDSPPAAAVDPPPIADPGGCVPASPRRVYDVRDVARAIVDGGRLLDVAVHWARNLVTCFARLHGRPVGVIANQPRFLGGVLDTAASEKAARFVSTCERFGIPLIVLVDTPGFMPGAHQESAGIIRRGAELVRAFASATVPRVTVILRKAYGGGYITMNSKALGADLALAWRDAEIGVMGARAAVGIVHRRALAAATDPHAIAERLAGDYTSDHISAMSALRHGVIDEVIAPPETRGRLADALLGA